MSQNPDHLVANDVIPCTAVHPVSKLEYDLRPLIRDSGEDWKIDDYSGGSFYLNVCRDILDKEKTGLGSGTNVGVFHKMSDGRGHIVGKVDRTPFFTGDRVILQYNGGDDCPGGGSYKKAAVFSFQCDKGASQSNPPQFITGVNNCTYLFEWKTPMACPTTLSSAGYGFFTIVFLLAVVYLLGGILFKRFVMNAYGMEQIPHVDFWTRVADTLKDFSMILFARCYTPRPANNRYGRLESDDQDQAFMDEDEDV